MKKQRFFYRFLATVLILCSLFLSVSCQTDPSKEGNDTDPDQETSTDQTETSTNEEASDIPSKENQIVLVQNGKSSFKIVLNFGYSDTILESANQIQKKILRLTGVTIPIVESSEITESDQCMILSTDTLPEAQELMRDWGYGNYGYQYQNNKLLILGHNDIQIEKAIDKLISGLNAAVTADGDLILNNDPAESVFLYDNWMTDIPHPEDEVSDVIDCGDNTFMLLLRNSSADKFQAYLAALEQNNYTLSQSNEINGNKFATYITTDGQVSVSYVSATKMLKIVCQKLEATVSIPSVTPETGYTKLSENKLAVMSLNYAEAIKDLTDGGGIGYVITLEDGRYIIIDGGYTADANGLYNYLCDNNTRSDGVVIAAWILTHGHGDHVSCFVNFVKLYASKVKCEYIISNALPDFYVMTSGANNSTLTNLFRYNGKFIGETKIIKPHAGQKMYFCNVEIEMLFTHEELYPRKVAYLNETSMAFKIKVGGQSILISGDTELQAVEVLNIMYGTTLKSDIFQINHHGYTAIPEKFFQNVGADVLLWPSSKETVALRSTTSWRNGLYTRLLASAKVCYVADEEVEILTLPYQSGDQIEAYTMDHSKRES